MNENTKVLTKEDVAAFRSQVEQAIGIDFPVWCQDSFLAFIDSHEALRELYKIEQRHLNELTKRVSELEKERDRLCKELVSIVTSYEDLKDEITDIRESAAGDCI